MQVRSPFLQTGLTKGHRSTCLFSFMLFQCGPDSMKAWSLYIRMPETDWIWPVQFTQIQHIPSHAVMHVQGNIFSFCTKARKRNWLTTVKTDLGLFAACSGWTLFPGHPGKACFKAKLRSGTKSSPHDLSFPTICTYFIYKYMYIHIRK